jgi:fumarate reductase flavoprotein subunit
MTTSAGPTTTVDVIVVGAGRAGNVAALTAAESGATVCLLEKADEAGGSSVKAGGGLLFAGTDLQAAAGVADDNDQLREAIVKAGRGKSDPTTVQVYLDYQLDLFRWVQAHGIEWALPLTGTNEISRMHTTPKGYLTRELHRQFTALDNTQFHARAAAKRLTRDADGRVSGVIADIAGVETAVAARQSVVLASGGFARSRELLETFAPQWADAVKMGGVENTGDGLRMAWALGAGLADMAYVEASFGASIKKYPDLTEDLTDEPRLLYPNSQGAIIVNLDGKRFANEALNYKILSSICERQPKGIGFQVFDDKVMNRSHPSPTPADFKTALADGYVVQAETLAELAASLLIDAATLQATVDTYNGYVDADNDPDFGRPMADYGTAGAGRLDTAPFYAFPCRSGLTTTYCGLTVNGRLQVLDVFGEPIPGLFAAGEVVGGFHGATYLSGTGLGKAAVFGRAAGLQCIAGAASASASD